MPMGRYAFTPNVAAQANVNNLTNRYYYDQLHFFHVVPGCGPYRTGESYRYASDT